MSRRPTGMTLAQIRQLPAAIDVTLAAQALGISRATAYNAISLGEFPAEVIRVNKRLKVLTASVVRVLEGRNGASEAA